MRTLDLENQFIELRAKGHGLRDIAEQLNVSKSTLSRWEPELAPQIQRLRRLLWEDAEAELGRSLEQDMKQLAARIQKWENELYQYQPEHFSIDDVLKVIRECRREYMHRRAILMAERPPKTPLSRPSTTCEPPESETRDKTGHISEITTESPSKTTNSEGAKPDLSHSASGGASCGPADEVSRPQVPPVLGENNPSTLGAQTSPEPVADSNDFGKVNQRSQAVPSPGAAETQGAGPRGEMGRTESLAAHSSKLGKGEGDSDHLALATSSANAVHDANQASPPPARLPAYPLSAPSFAEAVHDSAAAASHDSDTAIDRSQALPLPGAADEVSRSNKSFLGWGEGQTSSFMSPLPRAADEVSRPQVPPVLGDSQPSTLSARPEGPQPHDDFLGSVVINRLECGAGVILKCLEAEAAHRQRTSSQAPVFLTP